MHDILTRLWNPSQIFLTPSQDDCSNGDATRRYRARSVPHDVNLEWFPIVKMKFNNFLGLSTSTTYFQGPIITLFAHIFTTIWVYHSIKQMKLTTFSSINIKGHKTDKYLSGNPCNHEYQKCYVSHLMKCVVKQPPEAVHSLICIICT